jgi:uncharacterized integral membrane protein
MSERRTGAGWARRIKVVAVLVPAVLVLIVLFQNLGKARLVVLFWELQVPLVALLLIALAVGAVGGALLAIMRRRR